MIKLTFIFVLGSALCISAFAMLRGRLPERVVAGLLAASVVISIVLKDLPTEVFTLIQLVGDGVMAFVVLGLTLRYATVWLGFVMLLYAAQFGLHAFYFVTERSSDLVHNVASLVIFISSALALMAGTLGHVLKARTLEPAPSPA